MSTLASPTRSLPPPFTLPQIAAERALRSRHIGKRPVSAAIMNVTFRRPRAFDINLRVVSKALPGCGVREAPPDWQVKEPAAESEPGSVTHRALSSSEW
jgi:hypothetical protein